MTSRENNYYNSTTFKKQRNDSQTMYMNFNKTHPYLLLMLCVSLSFFSCTKEAGEGGLASISGKVYAHDYDKQGNLKAEGYIGEVRVYIGVEGSSELLDDVRTQYDGSYEFPFLRKGNYKIWVYTQCDSCLNDLLPIVQEAHITERKQRLVMPDFDIKL